MITMNFNVRKFFEQLLIFNLKEQGFEMEEGNSKLIHAYNPNNEEELIISLVTRNLSNKSEKESSVVNASKDVVEKLKSDISLLGRNSRTCLAFGIAKYGLDEFELAIVPTEVIENKATKGGVFAITNGGYYYDYQKIEQANEKDLVLRKKWQKK